MPRTIRASAAAARAAAAPAPAPSAPPPGVRTERGRSTLTTEAVDTRNKTVYHSETSEENLDEARFAPGDRIAEVEVRAGLTCNMGDFNSLRIDCFARMQCRPDQMEETYQQLSDFVADKVHEEEGKWIGT